MSPPLPKNKRPTTAAGRKTGRSVGRPKGSGVVYKPAKVGGRPRSRPVTLNPNKNPTKGGRPAKGKPVVKLVPYHQRFVTAEIFRRSYVDFVRGMWRTMSHEKPVWNWHVEYMCHCFQEKAERLFLGLPSEGILIANLPPGQTKSTVFSIASRGWLWTRMPHCQIMCSSHNSALSFELSQKARDVVRSDLYRGLFPHIRLRGDQNAVKKWMNTLGGWSFSCATGTSPVGRHGHVIISDDPIDPESAGREQSENITRANRYMSETLPSRLIPSNGASFMVLTHQRLAQNDPTGYLLERYRGTNRAQHVCLPSQDSDKVHPPALRALYQKNGGLLNPVHLSEQVLENKRLDLGDFGYAGQYDQDPVARGGNMFDVGVFSTRIVKAMPIGIEFESAIRYWDMAISTKKTGCYTVGVLMARQTLKDGLPIYWILDVVRGKWPSHIREDQVLLTAEADARRFGGRRNFKIGIEQEGGSAGEKVAQDFIRLLGGYNVISDSPNGQGDKPTRAEPFSRMVNRGGVYMVAGDWNNDYLEEMRYFPKSKWKDQMDASSGGFNILSTPRPAVFATTSVQPNGTTAR